MSTGTGRWLVAALAALPMAATAGRTMCGNTQVPSSVLRCPDGSLPVYRGDEMKSYVAPPVPVQRSQPIPGMPPPQNVQPMLPTQPAYPGVQPAYPSPQNAYPGVQPTYPGVQPAYPYQALPSQRPAPTDPVAAAGKIQSVKSADLKHFFGVWRTNVPGAVWTSPSGYAGQDWLHVRAGAAAGDLIIKPDGTYVWASYGGKSGRWVKGDAEYPLILIDTVENRRWKVGADVRHAGALMIWDGNAYHYNGRR